MAKARDWDAYAARYKKEAASTGITVKDFCAVHHLPVNSARRYIKPLESVFPVITNSVISDQVITSDQSSDQNNTEIPENQQVTKSQTVTTYQDNHQSLAAAGKRLAGRGNQNARKNGHYSEFIVTDQDVDRYASSSEADLRDELYITRTQHSAVLATVAKIEAAITKAQEEEADSDVLLGLFTQSNKAQALSVQRVNQIIGLENSIDKKMNDDIIREKNIALTRKANLEADKLERDGGKSTNSFAEVYEAILELDDDGMMSASVQFDDSDDE